MQYLKFLSHLVRISHSSMDKAKICHRHFPTFLLKLESLNLYQIHNLRCINKMSCKEMIHLFRYSTKKIYLFSQISWKLILLEILSSLQIPLDPLVRPFNIKLLLMAGVLLPFSRRLPLNNLLWQLILKITRITKIITPIYSTNHHFNSHQCLLSLIWILW